MQRYVRRIWMINSRFQWTIVGYTVGISALTTLVHFGVERMQLTWPTWASTVLLLSFNTAVVVFAMWISHRMAGPLWRLRNSLREAAEGKPVRKVYFRRWDYFHDLNEAYNAFIDTLPPDRKAPEPPPTGPGGAGPDKMPSPLSILKDQKGLTLAEMMVVVAIVGILVALNVATVGRPKEELLFKQDVTGLQDALLSARNAAFTRGQCAMVTVTTPTTIQINTYAVPSPCVGPLPAPDLQLTQAFLNSKVSNFTDSLGVSSTLTFHPRGGTLSTGPATITLTAQMTGNRTQQFTIYPAIGQIRQE